MGGFVSAEIGKISILGTRCTSPCWAFMNAAGLFLRKNGMLFVCELRKYLLAREDGGWDVLSDWLYHCTLVWVESLGSSLIFKKS